MKRTGSLLALAVLLVCGLPVQAQDEHSPQEHLDFARKLRDKGYVDLALEYLEAMRPNVPAPFERNLQFELTKTRLMLARGLDPEERLVLVDKARMEMEDYLKKYGNTAEAPVVRQDLKRLIGEQAQALLSLALRLRGVAAQQEKARQAEQYFMQAAAQLEASIPSLPTEADRLQARFDLAVLTVEQARCYMDLANEDIRFQRAAIVGKARKMFEELAKRDKGRIGLCSRAWLIKCCSEDEGGEPLVANKYYEELKNQLSKETEEARRLARYFQMVRIPDLAGSTLSKLDRYKKVQAEAEAWLKAYPTHVKTPIGYAVRYELAHALFQEASLIKDAQRQAALYGRAQDILYSLHESDNDLIGKVIDLRSRIARVHVSSQANSSISDLNTFNLCYDRAGIEFDKVQNLGRQIEMAREEAATKRLALQELKQEITGAKDAAERKRLESKLKDAEKALEEIDKKAAELDKKVTHQFRDVIQALSRALALADKHTPRYAVENVRFDLLVAYAKLENPSRTRTPYRTVVFGEAVAKAQPPSRHAPLALELAVDACARIVSVDPVASNRDRLRSLALFALSPERARLGENSNVVGLAHYHLALLEQSEATLLFAEAERIKDNVAILQAARAKFQEATEHLRQLPRERPGDLTRYFYAQSKAVFLALEARYKVAFPKEKEFYRDLARSMIAAMPPLPEGIEPTAIGMYFHAKMEESKFLYEDAGRLANQNQTALALQKYKEMAEFLDRITKELAEPAVKIDEARRDQLQYYIRTMEKHAVFGQADFEYKAGNYDKVLEPALTGKIVDFVKMEAEKNPVIRLKDFQITGQILGLALRAHVQIGQIEEAAQLMTILQNLKDVKDNLLVDTSAVLRTLVGELDGQMLEFRRKNDQEKLKRMQVNFTQFLDAVLKQAGTNPQRRELFFLARCFDSLEQHAKAATLYAQYPMPPTLNVVKKDKEKFSEDEERELQSYCYAQVMLARQLRLAKKTTEAKKILDAITAHRHARQLLLVEREQICLLEDTGLYGTAITRWSNFMNSPPFKGADLANDREKKKIYFDAYYHLTLSWYRYSQLDKAKSAGKEGLYLSRAADYIIRLENAQSPEGWQLIGHRFRELMQNEKLLRDAYMKQKGSI